MCVGRAQDPLGVGFNQRPWRNHSPLNPSKLETPLTEINVNPEKAQLLSLVQQLCNKHDWVLKGKPRTRAVLALLSQGPCERTVNYRLSNPGDTDDAVFDPAYAEKSELATSFIITSILDRLNAAGYAAAVAAEAKDVVGSYDIVILRGNPCLVLRGDETVVRVEIKASMGLPLSQLSRYLLSPTPLVIARIQLNQVIVLRPRDLEGFVKFMTELLSSKATRILQGAPYTVPSIQCRDCPDKGCPFHESPSRSQRLVAMAGEAFGDDLNRFYRNLPGACERTAELVLQEVKNCFEGRGA